MFVVCLSVSLFISLVEADKSEQDIHSRSAQDGKQSASASSSWRASGWQEAHESSGSHAPSPWPKLHKDDTRFEKCVRKRNFIAIHALRSLLFNPLVSMGHVRKCYEAEAEERKVEALQVMHARYMAGSWDATWWCSSCWLLLLLFVLGAFLVEPGISSFATTCAVAVAVLSKVRKPDGSQGKNGAKRHTFSNLCPHQKPTLEEGPR